MEDTSNDAEKEKSPLLEDETTNYNNISDYGSASVIPSPSSTVIEPPNQQRSRWRSIRVMYFTMFMSSVTFTMTMSTLWPYLQVVDKNASPSLLGWVVAAYSLGQLVASPVFGFWSSRRQAREPLIVSLILQVGANIFYAYVNSIHGNGGGYLILARALMGLASGNAAVVRAYVSGATTLMERTGAMTNVSLWQSVGFILGPVIQTVLVFVRYPGPVEKEWLHFNMYTSPAFLAAILAAVNFVLLLTLFTLHTMHDTERVSAAINVSDEDSETERKAYTDDDDNEKGPPDYIAVFVTMYLFFVVFFVFTVFETIATPMSMDMYGWTKSQASLYMGIMLAAAGFLAIAVFIVIKIIANRGVDERKLLIAGYIICLFGYITYLPWGNKLPVRGYAPLILPTAATTTTPVSVTMNIAWQQGQQPAWQRMPANRQLRNLQRQFPPVLPGQSQQGLLSLSRKDFSPLSPASGHTGAARRTYLTSVSQVNGPFKHFLALLVSGTDGGNITNLTTDTASSTADKTSPASITNSTSAPNGCPWDFAWCGKVPQVRLFQFILGAIFIAIGYPICNVMTYTLYSKVLGPQPQGLWMGYLTACGSLARTLGPVFVGQIYDAWGPRVTFGSSGAILVLTLVVNSAVFRRIVPFAISPYRKRSRNHAGNASDDWAGPASPSPGSL